MLTISSLFTHNALARSGWTLLKNLGQHDNELDFALQHMACHVRDKK